jgi:L-lactate utilization protein LutB
MKEVDMENPAKNFWKIRLESLKAVLEDNHFSVYIAADAGAAKQIFLDSILPETNAASVSWGGSMTASKTGLFDTLKERSDIEVIDSFEKGISPEESWQRRRRAFLVDLYLTGTNAVTDAGQLVNLDRTGNRVAATIFGPKHVVVFTGRNKIVPTLEDAFMRVKTLAAPMNAIRLDMKTPCAKTAACQDCSGADRLCNAWAITEKSYPKGRIKVILIDQDLGY